MPMASSKFDQDLEGAGPLALLKGASRKGARRYAKVWNEGLVAIRRILNFKYSLPKLINSFPSRASAYLCARPKDLNDSALVDYGCKGLQPSRSGPANSWAKTNPNYLRTGRVTATEMGSIPVAKGESGAGVKAPFESIL